jgi:hypothetical protein
MSVFSNFNFIWVLVIWLAGSGEVHVQRRFGGPEAAADHDDGMSTESCFVCAAATGWQLQGWMSHDLDSCCALCCAVQEPRPNYYEFEIKTPLVCNSKKGGRPSVPLPSLIAS